MSQNSDSRSKSKKRLASLDALRGFATISMIPFHILLFGIMFSGGDLGGGKVDLEKQYLVAHY